MVAKLSEYKISSRVTASIPNTENKVNKSREFHILISSNLTTELSETLISALETLDNVPIDICTISDEGLWPTHQSLALNSLILHNRYSTHIKNTEISRNSQGNASLKSCCRQADELCDWADLLVLAPVDADTIAKMLHGECNSLLLMILRGWNPKKNILMIPGMMKFMWENPMTKYHLSRIENICPWVQVLHPLIWKYEEEVSVKQNLDYDGYAELVHIISGRVEKATTAHNLHTFDYVPSTLARTDSKSRIQIPPEVLTLIFEYLGDWEISQALNIYTNIPVPIEWQNRVRKARDMFDKYLRSLEKIILTASIPKIISKLKEAPKNLTSLSSLCIKLVVKFCLVDVLTYLETNSKDIFRASFGQKFLPTLASAIFGQPKVLDWWHKSSSFPIIEYTAEAIDGASKMGFIHVLEWWRCSGLPLKYTEIAMEQASARGHIAVLDWWKKVGTESLPHLLESDVCHRNEINSDETSSLVENQSSLILLPGKSLLTAAQNNQSQVLRWWEKSCLPIGNSESVARVASQHGHVEVLDTWLELKGEKMSFDCQVLIDPTKNGHLNVLQWWKNLSRGANGQPGRTVQYKTCDIEEALEDSIRNDRITREVKEWWAQNGLNLGLQVRDWTRIRVL